MDDVTRLNRSRCLQIGRELINGPRALFPPTHGGPPDWFEPQLLITLRYPNYERIESVIVYCDDTMNKEDGFLSPMLRHAVWRRPNDLSGAHAWPSITVRLGSIKTPPAVDAASRCFNITFNYQLAPIGLSLKRDVADVIGVPTLPAYTISLRNGVQGFEYSSCSIENDSFSIQINDSFNALIAELNEIDPRGWVERYDRNLKTEFPATYWEWNYDEQSD